MVGLNAAVPTLTNASDGHNRPANTMDMEASTKYSSSAMSRLLTEDGPFASDIVTTLYNNGLRVDLSLQQPTGGWTNGFAYDLPRETGTEGVAGAPRRQRLASAGTFFTAPISRGDCRQLTSVAAPVHRGVAVPPA